MIEELLNKPYGADFKDQSKRSICWHFCCEVFAQFGTKLTCPHSQLTRIATTQVPCIVLFRAVLDWHSGVVWPDGLHFVHATPVNIFDLSPMQYIVREDRLTVWPYKSLVEGYYVP